MTPLLANAGIPMLFPQAILMGLALFPVTIIETFVLCRSLNLPKGKALLDVDLANLNSTIFGVPLAWGLMFGLALLTGRGFTWDTDSPIQMLAAVTLETAWLPPHYDQLFWMFPAAATGLLIPCFLASVLLEHWYLARCWKSLDRRELFRAVLRANLWSYLPLFSVGCSWFLINVQRYTKS